jgi:hypothetical protein
VTDIPIAMVSNTFSRTFNWAIVMSSPLRGRRAICYNISNCNRRQLSASSSRQERINEWPVLESGRATLNGRVWVFASIACLNERPLSRSRYVKPRQLTANRRLREPGLSLRPPRSSEAWPIYRVSPDLAERRFMDFRRERHPRFAQRRVLVRPTAP